MGYEEERTVTENELDFSEQAHNFMCNWILLSQTVYVSSKRKIPLDVVFFNVMNMIKQNPMICPSLEETDIHYYTIKEMNLVIKYIFHDEKLIFIEHIFNAHENIDADKKKELEKVRYKILKELFAEFGCDYDEATREYLAEQARLASMSNVDIIIEDICRR